MPHDDTTTTTAIDAITNALRQYDEHKGSIRRKTFDAKLIQQIRENANDPNAVLAILRQHIVKESLSAPSLSDFIAFDLYERLNAALTPASTHQAETQQKLTLSTESPLYTLSQDGETISIPTDLIAKIFSAPNLAPTNIFHLSTSHRNAHSSPELMLAMLAKAPDKHGVQLRWLKLQATKPWAPTHLQDHPHFKPTLETLLQHPAGCALHKLYCVIWLAKLQNAPEQHIEQLSETLNNLCDLTEPALDAIALYNLYFRIKKFEGTFDEKIDMLKELRGKATQLSPTQTKLFLPLLNAHLTTSTVVYSKWVCRALRALAPNLNRDQAFQQIQLLLTHSVLNVDKGDHYEAILIIKALTPKLDQEQIIALIDQLENHLDDTYGQIYNSAYDTLAQLESQFIQHSELRPKLIHVHLKCLELHSGKLRWRASKNLAALAATLSNVEACKLIGSLTDYLQHEEPDLRVLADLVIKAVLKKHPTSSSQPQCDDLIGSLVTCLQHHDEKIRGVDYLAIEKQASQFSQSQIDQLFDALNQFLADDKEYVCENACRLIETLVPQIKDKISPEKQITLVDPLLNSLRHRKHTINWLVCSNIIALKLELTPDQTSRLMNALIEYVQDPKHKSLSRGRSNAIGHYCQAVILMAPRFSITNIQHLINSTTIPVPEPLSRNRLSLLKYNAETWGKTPALIGQATWQLALRLDTNERDSVIDALLVRLEQSHFSDVSCSVLEALVPQIKQADARHQQEVLRLLINFLLKQDRDTNQKSAQALMALAPQLTPAQTSNTVERLKLRLEEARHTYETLLELDNTINVYCRLIQTLKPQFNQEQSNTLVHSLYVCLVITVPAIESRQKICQAIQTLAPQLSDTQFDSLINELNADLQNNQDRGRETACLALSALTSRLEKTHVDSLLKNLVSCLQGDRALEVREAASRVVLQIPAVKFPPETDAPLINHYRDCFPVITSTSPTPTPS